MKKNTDAALWATCRSTKSRHDTRSNDQHGRNHSAVPALSEPDSFPFRTLRRRRNWRLVPARWLARLADETQLRSDELGLRSGRLVWIAPRRVSKRAALIAFGAQLLLNAEWFAVFFGLHQPGWALFDISTLWCTIFTKIRLLRRQRPACWCRI